MSSRTLPIALKGVTKFCDEPELADELWAVRRLRQHPQWCDRLLDGTNLARNWGRPRAEGRWAFAYLAFVISRHPDVEPWWANATDALWRECGFTRKPSYQATWERFAELEGVADAFTEVANLLIQHARRHTGGKVGRDIHVDGTEAETNARLQHDCRESESCARRTRRRGNPVFPRRVNTDDARATRHKNSAEPTAEDDTPLDIGDATEIRHDEERHVTRVRIGGCWYRSLDETAGVRAYTTGGRTKRFWHGFYNHKAIDHYTGAPVAVLVTSSSVQEHASYPELLAKTVEAIGEAPRAVVGDRGISVKAVFERNTRAGIASVLPYRKYHGAPRRADTDTPRYDRHGVARCQHCGGPGRLLRFAAQPSPRLWFACELPVTPECEREQTIACSHDWRRLLPMWRTDETYFALRGSHASYERVHALWRSRYRVGGDNHTSRPKRIGIACQQLRANAALLIEWLRILDREGWLGSARRNREEEFDRRSRGALQRFLRHRVEKGLHLPYGPAADTLRAQELLPTEEFGPSPPGDDDRPF